MPERVTEQAIKTYIAAQSYAGLTLCSRFDSSEKVLPQLEIACTSARPADDSTSEFSGNWMVEIMLTLRSNYKDTTASAHDTFIGSIVYLFCADDIADTLNTAITGDDFKAMQVSLGERTLSVQEHEQITTQMVSVFMAPTSFA